ncbi:MAG: AAA family ATPase [Spirochaetales bacterium]|nr:AAA family ATPase [Spirochaetales bacterium]
MGKSIAIAGKGGTGKSTITAMIIKYLVEIGEGPILAIDADPDANLGTLLGLEQGTSVGELREDVLATFKNFPAGMSKAAYVEAGLHDIMVEMKGFDLITMGRGEGPGCYCYLNSLIRKFYDDLAPSYAWVVIDNEAGLEHLSRRTTGNIDALLIVVNDNPISLQTAEKVNKITEQISNVIRLKYVVTNMVPERRREALMEKVKALSVPYLCDFPLNENISDLIMDTGSLKGFDDPEFRERLKLIIDTIDTKKGG